MRCLMIQTVALLACMRRFACMHVRVRLLVSVCVCVRVRVFVCVSTQSEPAKEDFKVADDKTIDNMRCGLDGNASASAIVRLKVAHANACCSSRNANGHVVQALAASCSNCEGYAHATLSG